MNRQIKIYVAGHKGLAGSAILRKLQKEGYTNFLLKNHPELDLCNQQAVHYFFQKEKPDYVFLAAAKVGGILANQNYPASFIYNNLMIQSNVFEAAYQAGVKRLLFLGSSCIYPRNCPQPIKEEYLLSSTLEPTNEAYAVAKIAGVESIWSYNKQYGTRFLSIMPTNLYGPGDNYDLENSHVLPALLRKMHEAKGSVTVWGTGSAKREFLYSDDFAEAAVFLLMQEETLWQKIFAEERPLFNVGLGSDLSIKELVSAVSKTVGFKGDVIWDSSKPDGTPRKFLDCSRLFNLGWRPKHTLEEGLIKTYEDFCRNAFRG